jgi:hypothetical protein
MRCGSVVLAALCSLTLPGMAAQDMVTLHVTVAIVDGANVVPVPRYALLISDNPASAAPKRVVTAPDGTVDVRLKPGNYTVESDRPFVFGGKTYHWTQTLDVAANRQTDLALTATNAETESPGSAPLPSGGTLDGSSLWAQHADSVVALWTSTTRASAVLVDGRGVLATNQRAVGTATMVEVQVTPRVKFPASVLVSDAERDVALLRIHPSSVSAIRSVPIACGQTRPATLRGQEVTAIEAPLRRYKDMTWGVVTRVESRAIGSDLRLTPDGAGGPAFVETGELLGITSVPYDDMRARADARIVPAAELCAALAGIEAQLTEAAPAATPLPVEPERPFPAAALASESKRRAGNLGSYRASSADFDIVFLTPVLTYDAGDIPRPLSGPLSGFANWSEYVAENLPVVMVRVTPKLVEGFWAKVARGAAMTKGIALPPLKRFRPGFLRLRAFCGEAEVTPIHPFRLEQRISEADAIYEGLYVFDPTALSPACGTVKLTLFSEKAGATGETVVIGPRVIQQVWQDFAAYRPAQ